VALIVVLPTTLMFVAAVPPKVTVTPDTRLVPVILTDVPPPLGPEDGEIEVTVGACGGGGPPDAGNIVLSFFSAPGELFK
jgi:hypothetical protein